jgi:hypothetical protein
MPRKPKTTSAQWFEIPVFPIPVFGGKLMLCCSREEWSALAEAYAGDPDTEGCHGLTIRYRTKEDGRVYAIGVFDGNIDTFIHELAHAVFFLLGDVGVTLEDGGANEAYTYTAGFLVREALPVFLTAVGKIKIST